MHSATLATVVPRGAVGEARVELPPLATAVMHGKLELKLLLGVGYAATSAHLQLQAAARVWPLVSHLIRVMWPSDTTAAMAFMQLGVDAFDYARSTPEQGLLALTTVFAEHAARVKQYLATGLIYSGERPGEVQATPPTWMEARQIVRDRRRDAGTSSQLAATAIVKPADAAAAAAKAAKAKADAETAAAKAVATNEAKAAAADAKKAKDAAEAQKRRDAAAEKAAEKETAEPTPVVTFAAGSKKK